MKLLPELKAAYRFSVKGFVAKLTLIMSILSCVRLVTDVFQLPSTVFFSKLLHLYQVIFHTSIDAILKWLPFSIPPFVKDIAILYFLIGFIFQKVVFIQVFINYHNPWIISHEFKNSKLLYFCRAAKDMLSAAVFWPIYLKKTFKMPFLVIREGVHGPSALHFSAAVHADSKAYAYLGDSRLMMLIRLTAIIVGTLLVLAFNFAWST